MLLFEARYHYFSTNIWIERYQNIWRLWTIQFIRITKMSDINILWWPGYRSMYCFKFIQEITCCAFQVTRKITYAERSFIYSDFELSLIGKNNKTSFAYPMSLYFFVIGDFWMVTQRKEVFEHSGWNLWHMHVRNFEKFDIIW